MKNAEPETFERGAAYAELCLLERQLRRLNTPGTILLEAGQVLTVPRVKEWIAEVEEAQRRLLRAME